MHPQPTPSGLLPSGPFSKRLSAHPKTFRFAHAALEEKTDQPRGLKSQQQNKPVGSGAAPKPMTLAAPPGMGHNPPGWTRGEEGAVPSGGKGTRATPGCLSVTARAGSRGVPAVPAVLAAAADAAQRCRGAGGRRAEPGKGWQRDG